MTVLHHIEPELDQLRESATSCLIPLRRCELPKSVLHNVVESKWAESGARCV